MKTPSLHLGRLLMLVGLGVASVIHAEDLTTLSGRTYRDVVAVQVEPDGVTWRSATGLCKVDFTDSPETVRRAYRYDAAKAAAYQAAQQHARAEATAHTAVVLRENEARQQARIREMAAFGTASAGPGVLRYERGQTTLAPHDERHVGEQFEAFNARERAFRDNIGTIADPYVWDAIPPVIKLAAAMLMGGSGKGGSASKTGFAASSLADPFFKPDYETKAYKDDMAYADRIAGKQP